MFDCRCSSPDRWRDSRPARYFWYTGRLVEVSARSFRGTTYRHGHGISEHSVASVSRWRDSRPARYFWYTGRLVEVSAQSFRGTIYRYGHGISEHSVVSVSSGGECRKLRGESYSLCQTKSIMTLKTEMENLTDGGILTQRKCVCVCVCVCVMSLIHI